MSQRRGSAIHQDCARGSETDAIQLSPRPGGGGAERERRRSMREARGVAGGQADREQIRTRSGDIDKIPESAYGGLRDARGFVSELLRGAGGRWDE